MVMDGRDVPYLNSGDEIAVVVSYELCNKVTERFPNFRVVIVDESECYWAMRTSGFGIHAHYSKYHQVTI
jgi:hypothetical protein